LQVASHWLFNWMKRVYDSRGSMDRKSCRERKEEELRFFVQFGLFSCLLVSRNGIDPSSSLPNRTKAICSRIDFMSFRAAVKQRANEQRSSHILLSSPDFDCQTGSAWWCSPLVISGWWVTSWIRCEG
jgi:hypothetical protein